MLLLVLVFSVVVEFGVIVVVVAVEVVLVEIVVVVRVVLVIAFVVVVFAVVVVGLVAVVVILVVWEIVVVVKVVVVVVVVVVLWWVLWLQGPGSIQRDWLGPLDHPGSSRYRRLPAFIGPIKRPEIIHCIPCLALSQHKWPQHGASAASWAGGDWSMGVSQYPCILVSLPPTISGVTSAWQTSGCQLQAWTLVNRWT